MQLNPIFDRQVWAAVPFHFWSAVLFVFGSIVGSFLNVCIHRMPLGQSVVSPPSHCPHCRYSIPFYLNIPLVTWLYLRGRCRNCGAPISIRYFLVELLTACVFLAVWLAHGGRSPLVALVYCLVLAGFIAATFIDFEHMIIPDEITLGGMAAGFVCSFLVPGLHRAPTVARSLEQCFAGMVVGVVVVYAILRLGKWMYGRHDVELGGATRVYFTETAVKLPTEDLPYEELFYRGSDYIQLEAQEVEMVDRCYRNVTLRLSPRELLIGTDRFKPEEVECLEAVTARLTLPREAMGLGDVKFMGAIGAFLGWQAVFFSLMVSAMIGAGVGIALIAARRREWTSRLPYGPYIAAAAMLWIFVGPQLVRWWFGGLP